MSSRNPLAAVTVLCAAGASLALIACGGSGTSTAASAESSKATDAARFARCLREHGIEVSASPSGQIDIHSHAGAENPNALEAAQNACRRYAPQRKENLTPAERAQAEDAALKFAQCMRSHGVEVPNPTFSNSGGGFAIRLRAGPGKLNPSSPGFQAAQKACQSLLPKPRGGKGPGPSTSSSGSGQTGGSGQALSPGAGG
jgi:hypothetical protein